MHNETKKITEGAMMVAIVGLLLFVNRQFANMIEYIMYWILTFPILIYTAKYGLKDGLVPGSCMLLLSFILGAPTTIFYMFCCVVTGLVYGGGIRKEWKNKTLLGWTFVFTLFSYIITFLLFSAMFGYSVEEDMEIGKTILSIFHVSTSIPLEQIVLFISVLSTFLISMLQTICIHMLANQLLSRLKIKIHPMKNMFDIKAPKGLGVTILVIWLLFYIQSMLKLNQELSSILFVCAIICELCAIAYGILTLFCLCMVLRVRAGVFFVVVLLFVPYMQHVIAIVGVCDMLFEWKMKLKRGVVHGSIRKF